MSKLSLLKVNQILTQFADENPQIELTESQIADAVDLFDRLMNEKVNQTKNAWEQEALVTDIAIGYSIGESTDFIFKQHADNKHLNYFDVFLETGEADKIQQALLKHNIPTDVLKGIKKNVDFDVTIGNVRVVQTMSDGEDTSPTIDSFEIYQDGNLIYKWSPDEIWEENDDIFEPDKYYVPEQKLSPQPLTKSGKQRKGIYVATIVNSEGETTTKEITSKGQTIYRASNGRFAKK